MDEMTLERWQDPEAPGKYWLQPVGSLTIGQAAALKGALLEALGAACELQVDLSLVTQIDLSGLQLLCACHRSAQSLDKKFGIVDGGNRAYLDTVTNAGFTRHIGCARDLTGSCIWMGGAC
jgi:ABC-type transporter Mla MlaB component